MTNNNLFLTLKQAFPEHIQPIDSDDHGNAVAQIIAPHQDLTDRLQSSESSIGNIGGLIVVIQQEESKDNVEGERNIWLRNFLPQSHYPIDDVDELLAVIDGVIHNEVFWIMEYKIDESGDIDSWHSSTLIDKQDLIEHPHLPESGIDYQILSWLGDFDRLI